MDVTLREYILAYPGLSDCEDYLNKVVLPSRGLDGGECAIDVDPNVRTLVAADMYAMIGGLPDFTENKLSSTYPRSWYNTQARAMYRAGGEPEKAESIGAGVTIPKGRAVRRW